MNIAADRPRSDRRPLPASVAASLGGNRCGHRPSAPRFDALHLPEQANPARPALLLKAVAGLRGYYRSPRDPRWDALSQGERRCRWQRQKAVAMTAPPPGNGVPSKAGPKPVALWRQQRSERREAVIALLSLMVYYTDIVSLKIAVPSGSDWLGLSAPWLASHAGLSVSRVKRALATLARAAWVVNTGRGRQFDRRRRCWVGTGWGPVRRLSFRAIRALGLEVAWTRAQRQARKRATLPASAPPPLPAQPPLAGESPRLSAPPVDRATARDHARALRRSLLTPAARQAEADPAAHRAALERGRRIAELAAQGLSPAAIRRRLDDAPQPP